MTLTDVQSCAAKTLAFFIQTMPDVPFTEDDIVIEFAKKKDMAKRARELCAMYVPDKKINESQARQLNSSIAANALIGKEKSAVIVRENPKIPKKDWRKIFFHELMHIYCAKREMDGEHFIDIYGSGNTPEENPENKIYDGTITAGYVVWSEFIAEYFAIKKTIDDSFDFSDVIDYVYKLLCEVSVATNDMSKGSFSMACAILLNCGDVDEIVNPPEREDSDIPYENENKAALLNCLRLLYGQFQQDKPWKINLDFIETLGGKFHLFKVYNSVYLGHIEP